jgi:hypothetical protein
MGDGIVSESTELMSWDGAVEKYEAAYAAHRRMYELRNPLPTARAYDALETRPEASVVKGENRLTLVVLGFMVLAAVIVSGSRTVPEFGGGIIGGAAFVMIELGIVAFAFIRTRTDYDEAKHAGVKKLVNIGMWLAFAVAVSANLHATLKHNGVEIATWINVPILVMLSISAPVLAFISGDVAGMYSALDASRQRRADKEYKEQLAAWEAGRRAHEVEHEAAIEQWRDGLNASWNAAKAKMGVSIRVERDSASIPTLSNGNSIGNGMENQPAALPSASTLGHTKKAMARQIVEQYLDEHEEALEMPAMELATLLEVGKSTVYTVLKERKGA